MIEVVIRCKEEALSIKRASATRSTVAQDLMDQVESIIGEVFEEQLANVTVLLRFYDVFDVHDTDFFMKITADADTLHKNEDEIAEQVATRFTELLQYVLPPENLERFNSSIVWLVVPPRSASVSTGNYRW